VSERRWPEVHRAVVRALREASDLNARESATLLAIAAFVEPGGTAFPGQQLLADLRKVSTRTIQRDIKGLVRCGYITTRRQGRSSSLYTLTDRIMARCDVGDASVPPDPPLVSDPNATRVSGQADSPGLADADVTPALLDTPPIRHEEAPDATGEAPRHDTTLATELEERLEPRERGEHVGDLQSPTPTPPPVCSKCEGAGFTLEESNDFVDPVAVKCECRKRNGRRSSTPESLEVHVA